MNKLAKYYKKENNYVICELCPHMCKINNGNFGICKSRKNINGELYSTNYGEVTSISIDPIEKKPLKKFFQGSYILSAGSCGCNFKCDFCQNWSISQEMSVTRYYKPEELVELALKAKEEGNIGIAFTYNEPLIWYEYLMDTMKLSKEKGLVNVLVSNGYVNKEPLEDILNYTDAMNIDLKAFSNDFYRKYCSGSLNEVKRSIELSSKRCHVEITVLIIPGLNDSKGEIRNLAGWISSISKEIPLHISRYFPRYKMKLPPTPIDTMVNLKKVAAEYLEYVFLGNV